MRQRELRKIKTVDWMIYYKSNFWTAPRTNWYIVCYSEDEFLWDVMVNTKYIVAQWAVEQHESDID